MEIAAAMPLSVYVHLPWCVRKCPYCDFNSHTVGAAGQRSAYLDALERDLDTEAGAAGGRPVETIFIGGGTPSLFEPGEISRILAAIRDRLHVSADAEVTMEANPGTVERGSMRGYRDAGVNRLSLGAQSFSDDSLRRLGRIHGSAEITAAFAEARDAGFRNVNVDLMFALPGQTPTAARDDVAAALELAPEHISYYQLTLEPNTVFHARPPADLPDDDTAADMHEASLRHIEASGYERYEISALAKPGYECRHNLNYWRFGDYLGIGAGAHGKLTDASGRIWRSEKPSNPRRYVEASLAAEPAPRRLLGADDAVFEFMLNGLRLTRGFGAPDFEKRTGQPFARVLSQLVVAEKQGLIREAGGDVWQPTARGRSFLNDLQSRFLPSRTG